MNRLILLKTQLAEAGKYAKSNNYSHKRLAVILLDNFIEIQLSNLIKQKFRWYGVFRFEKKQYLEDKRLKILKYHDELLKACVAEDIITKDEHRLISFCHEVRNNLYHNTDEDELLVQVSLIIFHEIIQFRQPKWKTASDFAVSGEKLDSPFAIKNFKDLRFSGNHQKGWENFLLKYFYYIDKRKKNGSRILSDFLFNKIKGVRQAINYIQTNKREYYFPYAKDWEYNDFLKYYSFLNIKKHEIEKAKEIEDKIERKKTKENLYLDYNSSWKYSKISRLNSLEKSIKSIAIAPIYTALEKYISLRDEVKIIYDAFTHAATDLSIAIQNTIDYYNGK